jgi:hypothetical protein
MERTLVANHRLDDVNDRDHISDKVLIRDTLTAIQYARCSKSKMCFLWYDVYV